MIINQKAVIETQLAVRQFQVVYGVPAKLRFDEVLQIITPIPETPAEWEGKVYFVPQLVSGDEIRQYPPGIPKLNVSSGCGPQFAAGTIGPKTKERASR